MLVVDDDPDIRRLIEVQLQRRGHRTTAAGSGREALEALGQSDRPDVALLDLRMPDMDGTELLEHIRSSDATDDLPVVILSGMSRSETGGIADDPRCAYLMKPFTSDGLLDAILRLMPYARSA